MSFENSEPFDHNSPGPSNPATSRRDFNYDELLTILQDSDIEENFLDEDAESEEDDEVDEDVNGLYKTPRGTT